MRYKPLAAALSLAMIAVCVLAAAPAKAADADNSAMNASDDAVAGVTLDAQTTDTAASDAVSPTSTDAAGSQAPMSDSGAAAPAAGGDLRGLVAQMEGRVGDQQGEIARLKAELAKAGAAADAKTGESMPEESGVQENDGQMMFDVAGPDNNSPEQIPLVWRRLSLLVNLDFEYASQYNSAPLASPAGLNLGSGKSPDMIQPLSPNGAEGMYFGDAELHFKYQFNESMFAKLDYNLSALEVEDAGVGWQKLPFPPLTSGWGDFTYSVFVGQKRQYFGLEQQTDDDELMFPNRAMMFGGPNPFGSAAHPGQDPFDLYDQSTTIGGGAQPNTAASGAMIAELAYERTMGVHLYHAHDFGFLSYNLGVDIVNDESEDSVPGGGTDSLKTGFPLQTEDQDVSEIGRLGLKPEFLNEWLPFGAAFNFGASAFHDPENTAFFASETSQEEWSDAQGLDASLSTDRDVLYLQSEYVKRDQYGPSFTNTASPAVNNIYGGLQGRAESWYLSASFQPWRIFDPEAPRLELLARYESYFYDDTANWLQTALGPYAGSYNATTIALKYTYMGNCHTSVNYTSYGLNNNFNATGPTALLQLEQQVNF